MDSSDLAIKHCPAEVVRVDALSKPKQGAALGKDWTALMSTPVDCGNKAEQKVTHPSLMRRVSGKAQMRFSTEQRTDALLCHRSALDHQLETCIHCNYFCTICLVDGMMHAIHRGSLANNCLIVSLSIFSKRVSVQLKIRTA